MCTVYTQIIPKIMVNLCNTPVYVIITVKQHTYIVATGRLEYTLENMAYCTTIILYLRSSILNSLFPVTHPHGKI